MTNISSSPLTWTPLLLPPCERQFPRARGRRSGRRTSRPGTHDTRLDHSATTASRTTLSGWMGVRYRRLWIDPYYRCVDR